MSPTTNSDEVWYKNAVIYQLHIRAFCDSDGDGIGDFKGLVEKLDYLKYLGVTAVWVLPFYPSPLRDDGYDIANYEDINPAYGDLEDFRKFLAAAHERGIRVITELVINHTSDQHEWFQKSRRAAPGSVERDLYVWTDDPKKYQEARIIFRDFETSNWTWDPVAKAYYWHRFYSHQPDLNFDNPEVKKRIFKLIDYWMEMGVDGMRLDAVPYLFEREGTSCENLPETHAFLKELRAHLDKKYPDRMLLAEANQWPEDAAAYFGDGDECHMNFHFPLMPRLFMAVKMEDRFSILDILRQTPAIPDTCQWAIFLRNHDELTLEMVTDEERDYMYRAYASESRARINLGIRRRLAPLLENNRRQIELLNGLLMSLPGTPIIYYGDEIGMGDNIYLGDRDGVRTPFQWSPDRNAGFSKADPQRLFLPVIQTPEYHYATVNVETQKQNPNSLLRWMRSLIDIRQHNPALMSGDLQFLEPENQKVLVYIRDHAAQKVLVVVNLSRRAQYVELDMKAYQGYTPRELRGDTEFPRIGELPYLLTVGPYDFYWFELAPATQAIASSSVLPEQDETFPAQRLQDMHLPAVRQAMERRLRVYLPNARWFSGKGRQIADLKIVDMVDVPHGDNAGLSILLFTEVTYRDAREEPELYVIPVAAAEGERVTAIRAEHPALVLGTYRNADHSLQGIYYEAVLEPRFGQALARALMGKKHLAGDQGEVAGETVVAITPAMQENLPVPAFMGLEQSNTSLKFDKSYYFKLFRKLEEGENPEIEIGRHFARTGFTNSPGLIGNLVYRHGQKNYSLAVLDGFVESSGTAWDLFQKHLAIFTADAAAQDATVAEKLLADRPSFFDMEAANLPSWFVQATTSTAILVKRLGQRTGEMHRALAIADREPAFEPENFTPFYQRSLYQSMRNRAGSAHTRLRQATAKLEPRAAALREEVLEKWPSIDQEFERLRQGVIGGQRIRTHGDFHLGQVVVTGGDGGNADFSILDFEGEPMRSLSTRRLKHSPLLDVAGLLRSFDYSIYFFAHKNMGDEATRLRLKPWLKLWRSWLCRQFMDGYREACAGSALLPTDENQLRYLTKIFLLEKALYEVGYELANRPDWVRIPLSGVVDLLAMLQQSKGAN